jgi:hypothetical protein
VALAQNLAEAQEDAEAKQAAELLKSGAIPISWEWKTNRLNLRSDDVRSRRCSGFEVVLRTDILGQGGLILIDDIYVLQYLDKN